MLRGGSIAFSVTNETQGSKNFIRFFDIILLKSSLAYLLKFYLFWPQIDFHFWFWTSFKRIEFNPVERLSCAMYQITQRPSPNGCKLESRMWEITLSPLMPLTIRNFYKEPPMNHILGHSSTTFSTISHFYWYVFNHRHQLWYWGYPQTENRSKILLNDLMVYFLLEATLELILTGDAKCSSLTEDTVLHLGVLPDVRLSIIVTHRIFPLFWSCSKILYRA